MSHPVTSVQDPAPESPDAPREPAISWCGIRDSPYAIRNSEFGNQKSGIGNRPANIDPNQVHGNLHGAVFSLLTTGVMVR